MSNKKPYYLRWNFAILAAQLLILLVSFFIFIPQLSSELVTTQGQNTDAIAIAAQIGRLDVISLVFAMMGIILALFAFAGFFSIRAHSEHIAKTVAKDIAEIESKKYIDLFESSFNVKAPTVNLRTRVTDIDTADAVEMKGDQQ